MIRKTANSIQMLNALLNVGSAPVVLSVHPLGAHIQERTHEGLARVHVHLSFFTRDESLGT